MVLKIIEIIFFEQIEIINNPSKGSHEIFISKTAEIVDSVKKHLLFKFI